MATIIDTGLLLSGLRSEFFTGYDVKDKLAIYQQLAMRTTSTKDQENYRWLGSVPPMRRWGDGRAPRGMYTHLYDVINQKYEDTLEIDRDEIDDEQTNQIRPRIAQLSDRAAQHKDELLSELLLFGAVTGFNSYDKVTFFNASHNSGQSTNQSNDIALTAANNGVNPGGPATTAEWRDALRKMVSAMMGFLDDQGRPMMPMRPNSLLLLVHPLQYPTAIEACQAQIISQTTNVTAGWVTPISWPWLAMQGAISAQANANYYANTSYLCYAGDAVRPFIFQDRMPIEFNSLEINSETGFNTERFRYGIRARYAMAYGYWQYCIRGNFGTAGVPVVTDLPL